MGHFMVGNTFGKNNVGSNNGNWHGGKTTTNRGYKKVLKKGHPRGDRDGYVLEHILVMEKHLGRYLDRKEVVHHINHNKLDNRIENLKLYSSHAEHLKEHNKKLGKIVRCDTCGKEFYKKRCKLSKYNFCCKDHLKPLWLRKGGVV